MRSSKPLIFLKKKEVKIPLDTGQGSPVEYPLSHSKSPGEFQHEYYDQILCRYSQFPIHSRQ